jgi:D-beta-D-heptose 7-phosphate kinase / D-beta-D-heptose 1-phosphate adenosyltransferase
MTDTATVPDADLVAAVRRLARASVLVVGDVMLDRFVFGTVERVSPEAPVPILNVAREVAYPGGAGNVVRSLTALGAAVALVSIIGDDQAGSELTGLIGGQPNVEPWLLVQGGRLTTVKTRYLAGCQQLLRTDQEDPGPVQARLAERMISIARNAIAATSIVVLSDYAKGVLEGDVAPQLIAAAGQAGRRVVADPKGANLARFAGADVLIPNLGELAAATGMRVGSDEAIAAAAAALAAEHRLGAVLVPRGRGGMTLVRDGGAIRLPPEKGERVDPAGAADAVAAVVAAGLAAGLDLAIAARLANVAAGIVVGKLGTAAVESAELIAAVGGGGFECGTPRASVARLRH